MDLHQYPRPLRAAITQLADSNVQLHVPASITDDDALPFAKDDDVLHAWWTVKRVEREDLSEFITVLENIEPLKMHQLIVAICCGHASAVKTLRDAIVAHVAHDISYEAGKLQEAETGEPAERPYDPTAADRRALAREVNGALRVAGVRS